MHTYEYLELTELHTSGVRKLDEPRRRGEVAAAQLLVSMARGEYDAIGDAHYRTGEHGDDPTDVYADNLLLDMRRNLATENVLRAEGILACAEKRLARYLDIA